MSDATRRNITAELARMRMWRRVGDEREAQRCNDRINDLLDRMLASTRPSTVAQSGQVTALNLSLERRAFCAARPRIRPVIFGA